jgi:hypothetical protein
MSQAEVFLPTAVAKKRKSPGATAAMEKAGG